MPQKKLSEPITPSPIAIIVAGNVGGIGKSSYLINLSDCFAIASRPLDLLQVDGQDKVGRMTGQPVTSIDLAVFSSVREDEWAVQRAMRPLYDTIVAMPETGRSCAIEIGGSMSAMTYEALAVIDMAEETEELGIPVDCHIVVVSSDESLQQAILEVDRHRAAFPGGRIVFVLNNRLHDVRRFIEEDAADELRRPMLKLLAENPVITMRQVAKPTMKLWNKLAVRPSLVATWRVTGGYGLVAQRTGLDRFEAKLFAGEIVGWSGGLRHQLTGIYPMLEVPHAE